MSSILIRDAEIDFALRVDVRIQAGRIHTIAPAGELKLLADETLIVASGHALLPGLHDHHLHLAALATALQSIDCGPPAVLTALQLAEQLRSAADTGQGWLRGINYHDSVAGEIDRDWLDQVVSDRPLRVQHRSGRLWILNSCALLELNAESCAPRGLEQHAGRATGRLFDNDAWLGAQLPRRFPDLARVGQQLLRFGITGVSDATPHNDAELAHHFARAQQHNELPQRLLLLGNEKLMDFTPAPSSTSGLRTDALKCGALKLHLLESQFPDFDAFVARIQAAHRNDRPVAIHAVSRSELVFALGALEVAGTHFLDRIEHASITPPDLLAQLAALRLTTVSQPAFIHARGDHYRQEVDHDDQPWLYRLRAFLDARLPLAGSSDAPFGPLSPWLAMQTAVDRSSSSGARLGQAERLNPEEALQLYLAPLDNPAAPPRRIQTGALADLCLLDRPWALARQQLNAVRVRFTFCAGRPHAIIADCQPQ